MTKYTAAELRRLDVLGNFEMTRDEALNVECPVEGCRKLVGERCVNAENGDLLRAPAHWQRLREAERQENP